MTRAGLSFAFAFSSLSLVLACGADPVPSDGSETQADASDSGTTTAETTAADTTTTAADSTTTPDGTTGDTGGFAVPEFGNTFTVIGTAADGLNAVRDLEFDPGAPDRLWTFNMLSHGTVIFFEPGTEQQTSEVRIDAYGQHFMAYVSSAAFGDNGNFASCQESRDEWNVGPQDPDDFMGPTLWSADLEIFAVVGQAFPPEGGVEGSHLDMLHQSPLCMGIAHDVDNVYWAMDGLEGNLVRYDFQADHGPGGGDHSDGVIWRYTDTMVTRLANIPGHMELDHATGMLYVVDTGGRLMRLDTASGTNIGSLPGDWDGATYEGVEGADFQVVVEGFDEPSGLALHEGRLFVSEHATGDVVALDLDGNELDRMSTPADRIMGLAIGPAGDLWYADAGANEIVRVDP
jgi:sugar lactone lactonase YvrE